MRRPRTGCVVQHQMFVRSNRSPPKLLVCSSSITFVGVDQWACNGSKVRIPDNLLTNISLWMHFTCQALSRYPRSIQRQQIARTTMQAAPTTRSPIQGLLSLTPIIPYLTPSMM